MEASICTTDEKPEKLQANTQNSDRISSLHDSILYHILSFLPTKNVVQNRILSKRWNKLWISLPYLNFEESGKTTDKEWFMNFVDNVLFYHNKLITIIKFRLACYNACDDSHVNKWISDAAEARVEELDLYVKGWLNVHALPSLSLCKSLEILKLEFESPVRFPESFDFPKLKVMNTYNIIAQENFSQQLLNSPNLKILFLQSFEVEISCPSSPKSPTDHPGILSNLDRVHIWLRIRKSPSDRESGLWVSEFIRKLANVKDLGLASYGITKFLQCKSNVLHHLPTFFNLRKLELVVGDDKGDVGVMACLLHCSPVLQSLRIRFCSYRWPDHLQYQTNEFPSLFRCRPASLRWIGIHGFCGEFYQFELLRFFLVGKHDALVVQLINPEKTYDLTSLHKKLSEYRIIRKLIKQHKLFIKPSKNLISFSFRN